MNHSTSVRYHPMVQSMHWLTFWLLLLVYGVTLLEDFFPKDSDERHFIWFAHISVGLLLVMLVVARLVTKMTHQSWYLKHEASEKKAVAVHHLLYLLMLLTLVVGIYLAFIRGDEVSFFSLLTIPSPLEPNPELKELLQEVHELLANGLMFFVFLHAGAAIFHHRVLKDDVLNRMLPESRKD